MTLFGSIKWVLGGLGVIGALCSVSGGESAAAMSGAKIYERHCASCHGPKGEGVADKHDEPLYGERSLESLARYIHRTMPEEKPEECVDEEAKEVARYIYEEFYSPEARARINPPRIQLTRLTNRQYRESVADLIGSFGPSSSSELTLGGLEGDYYQSKKMNKKDQKKFTRKDGALNFDFRNEGPGGGVAPDQFSIAWEGSLRVDDTGFHDFRLSTPNGARLYINTDLLRGDRNRRDDSSDKRQPALIDLWVSSGGKMREETERLYLLGGRDYPIRLDYFSYQETNASIRLEWKPPQGVWSVLSGDHLAAESSPSVAVISTSFPADDGSLGYERGTTVSKEWDRATTMGAIEAAGQVADRIHALTGVGDKDPDRVEKLKEFSVKFAERAFRRPLTGELRSVYVDRHFEGEVDPVTAVKRVVLLALKSPLFLYPGADGVRDDYAVAASLALDLWDSVPDEALREAASQGRLRTPEQVRAAAARMMEDPRARAKLRAFFHHWLAVEEAEDIAKDQDAFPEFDRGFVVDLRHSLDEFVESVVWSEKSDYRELLLADYLYLNPRLAKFYGVDPVEGKGFEPVKFDSRERAGIFTHPFLLSTFSYHKSTSPIHRGVFLTRNVLGRFLKPPPMAIEFMDDRFDPSLTMREKVTELTSKRVCQACHATINPLGFSLENYDAVGRFRTMDNDKPVNAESDYTTADGVVLRLRGARDLAVHAADDASARRGFVRQLFHHTVKQAPAAYGPETLRRLDGVFVSSDHHIRDLTVEIATTAALHQLANE